MTLSAGAGKILVVDDHVDLAENLAEILAGAGYEAVIAASAEAGLARLTEGDIAGLITDYRLPGLNGAQLIVEMRRRGNGLPAVVMSAFTDDETIALARAAGAAEVLSKPIPIDRMLTLVSAMTNDASVAEDNRELAENLEALARGTATSPRR